MKNTNQSAQIDDEDVENLVPTRTAYATAAGILFITGITGGLIGYALMKVFFPTISGIGRSIGTCIICGSIIYGVSVITSLGLQASVEWKSRRALGPEKKRPSRLVRTDDRD